MILYTSSTHLVSNKSTKGLRNQVLLVGREAHRVMHLSTRCFSRAVLLELRTKKIGSCGIVHYLLLVALKERWTVPERNYGKTYYFCHFS